MTVAEILREALTLRAGWGLIPDAEWWDRVGRLVLWADSRRAELEQVERDMEATCR